MRAASLLALGVAAGAVALPPAGGGEAAAQLVPPLAAPPSPATAGPPPPVVLGGPSAAGPVAGAPPAVTPYAAVPLPPGFAVLPGGTGWRLTGPASRGAPDAREAAALGALGRAMAGRTPPGRVTVAVRVAGPDDDPSAARRESLSRARALEAALVAGGLDATRVDLRPLGRAEDGVDAAELLPPSLPAPRPPPPPAPAAAAPAAPAKQSPTPAPGAGRGGTPAEASRR